VRDWSIGRPGHRGTPVEVALKMHTGLTMDDFGRLNERAQTLRAIDHENVMHLVDVFVGTALIDSDESAMKTSA